MNFRAAQFHLRSPKFALRLGIIIKRNFIEGDKVSKGESLYQIDPAPLQARLDSAKGALAKAMATANNIRLTLNRQSALIKSNYVSRRDYDTTRSQLNEAQANVAVAKAELEQATINLRYANVTSPIEGISGKSSVTVGAPSPPIRKMRWSPFNGWIRFMLI